VRGGKGKYINDKKSLLKVEEKSPLSEKGPLGQSKERALIAWERTLSHLEVFARGEKPHLQPRSEFSQKLEKKEEKESHLGEKEGSTGVRELRRWRGKRK